LNSDKIGFLQDRFTLGTIAGAAGWIPQAVFTLSMYSFHLTKLRYADFAAILAFNHRPQTVWDMILAELVVILFQMALGGVFAWWIGVVGGPNLLWKGAFFGGFAWFIIYTVTALYKLPGLYPIGSATALFNMISSLIYGVVMGWSYSFLTRKCILKN
jgi:hypothetical protein